MCTSDDDDDIRTQQKKILVNRKFADADDIAIELLNIFVKKSCSQRWHRNSAVEYFCDE